jgi:cell division GTPase FtsZ
MRDPQAVGIASVVARIARKRFQVTLGIAMRPFSFEPEQSRRTARRNEKAFAPCVESLIVIPSKLVTARRKVPDEDGRQALREGANELCRVAVAGLYEGIGKGLYRDIEEPDVPVYYDYRGLLGAKAILLGTGAASGEDSSRMAVLRALDNPLLATQKVLRGLNKILINITAGPDACLSYQDVRDAVRLLRRHVHRDAYIVCAVSTEDSLAEEFRIALFAEEFGVQ